MSDDARAKAKRGEQANSITAKRFLPSSESARERERAWQKVNNMIEKQKISKCNYKIALAYIKAF